MKRKGVIEKQGKRKEETINLDECWKIKGLRDDRGEARMLLKRKAVIALFSAKRHEFMGIPQARRAARLNRLVIIRRVLHHSDARFHGCWR